MGVQTRLRIKKRFFVCPPRIKRRWVRAKCRRGIIASRPLAFPTADLCIIILEGSFRCYRLILKGFIQAENRVFYCETVCSKIFQILVWLRVNSSTLVNTKMKNWLALLLMVFVFNLLGTGCGYITLEQKRVRNKLRQFTGRTASTIADPSSHQKQVSLPYYNNSAAFTSASNGGGNEGWSTGMEIPYL